MARYIDFDKLERKLYKEVYFTRIKDSPNEEVLWSLFCTMMNTIELQDKVTDWDSRKKLLQPKRGRHDWDVLNTVVNAVIDDRRGTHENWDEVFRDWLAEYMFDYDIDPAELLMEPTEEKKNA